MIMKGKSIRNISAWFKQIPMPVLFAAAILILVSAYILSVSGQYIDRSLTRIKGLHG